MRHKINKKIRLTNLEQTSIFDIENFDLLTLHFNEWGYMKRVIVWGKVKHIFKFVSSKYKIGVSLCPVLPYFKNLKVAQFWQ
jgi:hypothetical protein